MGMLGSPVAHMYLFSDACPADWLEAGQDARWHTIVNFVFESDPALLEEIKAGVGHRQILERDSLFVGLIEGIQQNLPGKELKKWESRGNYKADFCKAISKLVGENRILITACSFQEQTLRASKQALLKSYVSRVGGSDGRGSNFSEYIDRKGRTFMRQSFVNFSGYHTLDALENKMLVLLFTSWLVSDQYVFYQKSFQNHAAGRLLFTIVSDVFSGDSETISAARVILRNLIDPDGDNEAILLSHANKADCFAGDLLADNFAGWLTKAISEPRGNFAELAMDLKSSGLWHGWHLLQPSVDFLKSSPAIAALNAARS